MAQLPASFNPEGREGVGSFDALDGGDYIAHIVKSAMKENKKKTGSYLELMWEILAGEKAKRKIWTRLNLVNPNEVAVEIANKHLTSICEATGTPGPISDSSVLHGKPIQIRVKKTEATSEFPEGNDITNYKPIEGDVAAQASAAAAAIASEAPAPDAPAAPATAPAAPASPAATAAAGAEGKPTPPWLKK